jgi:mRNA interferase YafQ
LKAVIVTGRFKRDYKAFKNNVIVETALREVLAFLQNGEELPYKFKDHSLIGEFLGCRDCHLLNDVVLIYECKDEEIKLMRIGNHSNVFKR